MREDATDQALEKGLHIALPALQNTEQAMLELGGLHHFRNERDNEV